MSALPPSPHLPPLAETLRSVRYLTFGACGAKGVAYLGSLKALQEHHRDHAEWHRQLRGTCGSSSGCAAALAFLVNADAEELIRRWRLLNIQSLTTHLDLHAVFSRYGLDGGGEVRRIIREIFAACGLSHDTTFRTLHRLTGRDLRICVTNLNRVRLEVFTHLTTPDVVVSDAMYWSMTVPFVFQPETWRGDLMIDGGALAYVPVDIWESPEETLTFHTSGFSTGASVDRREIGDLQSFAGGVMSCCAHSFLKIVDTLQKAHPERFLRIMARDRAHDVVLHMTEETLDALVNLGFGTTLARLEPQVPGVVQELVRISVALEPLLVAEAQSREEGEA